MDDHKAYLLEEFKALKAEIAVLLAGAWTNLQWAAAGSGALFTWMASAFTACPEYTGSVSLDPYAFASFAYMLALLSAVLGLQALASYLRIRGMGRYLRKIEFLIVGTESAAAQAAAPEG